MIKSQQEPVYIIIPDDTCFIDPHFFTGLFGFWLDAVANILKPINTQLKIQLCDRYKFINRGRYKIDDELDEAIDEAIKKLSTKA